MALVNIVKFYQLRKIAPQKRHLEYVIRILREEGYEKIRVGGETTELK